MVGALSARARIAGIGLLLAGALVVSALNGCGTTEEETAAPPIVPAGEHDPAVWGAEFPEEYGTWLATAEPRPAGLSKYKRGFDGGEMFDKLSEYPFMPLLFNGWGFGIDYNEPRGHYYMLIDQSEVDPARVKAGGACLTCKSSYTQDLYQEDKDALFDATYDEAVALIPEEHRSLGATCIDCHDNATMELQTRRWTVEGALTEVGLDPENLTTQQQRLMVCGQCHCTYSVMKDGDKSVDVDFPWEGAEWGSITAEVIIDNLTGNTSRLEWTQKVTGLKVGFIRHPDVEFFTAGSPHMNVGLACDDCHMPDVTINNKTVSSHNLMSPLKADMVACKRCHYDTTEELRAKVLALQDANASLLINAGYKTATAAKLLELANASIETSSADVKPAYDEAVGHYMQAMYRVIYMGAENSMGFHNPAEGRRLLQDAAAEADTAAGILREILTGRGVSIPAEVPLQLRTYLDNRGIHQKGFVAAHYLPDPAGIAQATWPTSLAALLR